MIPTNFGGWLEGGPLRGNAPQSGRPEARPQKDKS